MRTHALLIASILLLFTSPVRAQSELPAHKWSHCTTLSMSGGMAGGSDQAGAAIGAAIGWEITPRIGWEVSGTWFDKQPGSTAYSAALSVRAVLANTLRPPRSWKEVPLRRLAAVVVPPTGGSNSF